MPNYDILGYRNTVKVHRHTGRMQRYYPQTSGAPSTYLPDTPIKRCYEMSFDQLLFDFITSEIDAETFVKLFRELLNDFNKRAKAQTIKYSPIARCRGVRACFVVQKGDDTSIASVISSVNIDGGSSRADALRDAFQDILAAQ